MHLGVGGRIIELGRGGIIQLEGSYRGRMSLFYAPKFIPY